jgi:hypothetical protein
LVVTAPVITAHPVQLTFAAACADVYHEEQAASEGAARCGVAYLIRADRAVTCAQVVRDRAVGQPVFLRFSGGLRAATVLARDEEADCALLELRSAVISQLALTLRRGLCAPGDVCQTWSSRPTLRAPGQVVQALVEEPLGEDELRGPALRLHLVAGSERWHESLAGSPILHDGFVVGHLRAITEAGGEAVLVACPAPHIEALELLPDAARPPQPPKAAYAPAWYVARPDEEARAFAGLETPSRPLLVWAPEGHGKTWFLHHLLSAVRRRGDIGVRVNIERLPALSQASLSALSAELSQRLHRQLAADFGSALDGTSTLPLTELLELGLRAAAPRRLYVALDQFDMLRDTMFHEGASALLADWIERSATREVWQGLRLLLFSATAPDWLMRPLASRPFAALTQELPDLSLSQLESLCHLHQLAPEPSELQALAAQIGGHPYLSRVALYAAASRGETLGDVLHSRGSTVFEPFLEACQRRVAAQPGLWPTLLRVLREQPLEALDRLLLPRLERMGIVRRVDLDGPQPEYALRYPLYRRLLEL